MYQKSEAAPRHVSETITMAVSVSEFKLDTNPGSGACRIVQGLVQVPLKQILCLCFFLIDRLLPRCSLLVH